MKSWPIQDAEARFGESFDTCLKEGLHLATTDGEDVAILSRFRKSGSRFCDKNLRQNKKLSGRSVGLPTQVC